MTKQISHHFTLIISQSKPNKKMMVAEIPEISGALVYGNSQQQAIHYVQALALQVIADKLEHGEVDLRLTCFEFVAA